MYFSISVWLYKPVSSQYKVPQAGWRWYKLSNSKDIWGRVGSEAAKTCPLEVMMLTGKTTYWPLLITFIFHAVVPQAGNSTESTLAVAQPSLIKGTQNICSPFSETRRIFKIWIFDFYTLLTSVTSLCILVLTFCGGKIIKFFKNDLSGGSILSLPW